MKKTVDKVFQKNKSAVVVTAYDYPTAVILEAAEIDAVLVGDSLGNVVLGYESTLQVTMSDMLHHVKAVARGVKRIPLIADMPFMSYQVSMEEALKNAGELMQAGASAVKLEGGKRIEKTVEKLVESGIPVMGHLGLTPQSIYQLGGYRVQGKSEEERQKFLDDAKRLEEAGVFSIVVECIPSELTQKISDQSSVPIIGIGAGPHCEAQVIVFHDILGLSAEGGNYMFVKKYSNLFENAVEALKNFKKDVEEGKFPGTEHSFFLSSEDD